MKNKKQRILAIFSLAIALICTTVAYAILQTTLNVSGSVTKKGGSWNIHIDNISNIKLKGDATLDVDDPSGTTLTFSGSLKKPLDAFSFDFDIINGGTVDANFQSLYGNFGGAVMTINNETVGEDNTVAFAGEAMTCSLLYKGTDLATAYASDKTLLNVVAGANNEIGTKKTLTLTCSYAAGDYIEETDAGMNFSLTFNYIQS